MDGSVIIAETPLPGAFVVDPERREDERGFFARSFSREEFLAAGLSPAVEQMSISYSRRAGTLRGMHFQVAPALESKYIRCTAGAVVDVVVDLRPDSPTYLQHLEVELTAANRRSVYVPPLFAHGHQTLVDDSELTYVVSAPYDPGCERGIRHDDPGWAWPGRCR